MLLLALLAGGNIAFHLEAHVGGGADVAARLGLGVAVLLITLIGGHSSEFHPQLACPREPRSFAAPFGRFDVLAMRQRVLPHSSAWVIMPRTSIAGGLLALAGILQLVRLARWAETALHASA